MAAIDFPSSPSNGDTHTVGGVTYTYNSAETKWKTTVNSNNFLPLTGGTLSGNLNMGTNDLTVGDVTASGTASLSGLTYPTSDGTSGQYLQTNGSGALSFATVNASNLTRLTSVALTNQTSVDFTSLPSGIRKLSLVLDGINCSSTGTLMIQLGDSGGLETSGYVSGSRLFYSSTTSTYHERSDSFVVYEDSADWYKNGIVEIINITGNRWVSSHTVYYSERGPYPGVTSNGGGRKELSGELTQLRFTLSAGNFTAGNVNLLYEV